MGRYREKNKPSTINGLTLSVAKRVCMYAFGDYLYKVEQEGQDFIITLHCVIDEEPVSESVIEDFMIFWGNCFKIKFIEVKN